MSESQPALAAAAAEPLVPQLTLAVLIACVAGAGILANCSLVTALFRAPKNGLFSIIIQLAIADLILGVTISPELWSYNSRTWVFGNSGCMIYRGLNVFASTASSYVVVTIALHTLASIHLEEKYFSSRNKTNEDEELRSSRHSLVTSSNSSTPLRTMNLDYRFNDNKIPVAQPMAFVWILSISLSVPEFVMAFIMHSDHGVLLCGVMDSSHKTHLYTILVLLNMILQAIIMFSSGFLVIVKLKSKKILFDNSESIASLNLSLFLIIVFIVLCAPHSLLAGYNYYSTLMNGNETSWLEIAHHNDALTLLNVVLSGAYITSTLVRPTLCIVLLPSIRKMFSFHSVDTNLNV